MMGSDGILPLRCLHTSRPLIRGIITSNTTRSGRSARARSRPATPSCAVMTSYPSYSKLSRSPATIAGSSSTIKIRVFIFVLLSASPVLAGTILVWFSFIMLILCCSSVGQTACCLGNFCLQRQRQSEFAALSRRAFYLHLTSVRVSDVLNQRESKTAALGVVHQRVTGPVELLEYLRLVVARNAYPAINHLELHRTIR